MFHRACTVSLFQINRLTVLVGCIVFLSMDDELIRKLRSDFARQGGLARAKKLTAKQPKESAIKASKAAAKARARKAKERKDKMAEQIVRCPYCVLGEGFRPMLSRAEYWFICQKCGHIAMPGKPGFKCFCQKCSKLSRAA